MSFAARHDWRAYEALTAASRAELARARSPREQLAIYCDLHAIVQNARRGQPGDWERLERWNWEQKLATRQRFVDAVRRWEQRNGRTLDDPNRP